MTNTQLFQSFFLGGFECSTHYTRARKRLDVIAASAHDKFVEADYMRLHAHNMRAARDGIRWHLIEKSPGQYDFSSVLPMVHAARDTGTQVIWDLCHYGWPDDLDILSAAFINRFARLAEAFTRLLRSETNQTPYIAPVNEVSFFAWAGAEVAYINPFVKNQGFKLKRQLIRATIEATEAIWSVTPSARIFQIDPLIQVHARRPKDLAIAEAYNEVEYESWDLLAGRLEPNLGGAEKYLDVIGFNYYQQNQWFYPGPTFGLDHPQYRPFRFLLIEAYKRYRRPSFIAETGEENDARPSWLSYLCDEVRHAMLDGVRLEGICLYPILNHPGWDDDRHCHNGLWDYADAIGGRDVYAPLAEELNRQQQLFDALSAKVEDT